MFTHNAIRCNSHTSTSDAPNVKQRRAFPGRSLRPLACAIGLATGTWLIPGISHADALEFIGQLYENGVPVDAAIGVREGADVRLQIDMELGYRNYQVPDQTCQVWGTLVVQRSDSSDVHPTVTIVGDNQVTFEVTVEKDELSWGPPADFELDVPASDETGFGVWIVKQSHNCTGIDNQWFVDGDSGYGFALYAPIREADAPPPIPANDALLASAMSTTLAQLESATTISLQNSYARSRTIARELARRRRNESGFDMQSLSMNVMGSSIAVGRLGGAAGDSDLDSSWGSFLSGTVELGNKSSGDADTRVDATSSMLVAGIDYHAGQWILGSALMLAAAEADLADVKNAVEVGQAGLSVFSSYFNRRVYLDWLISYTRNDYDFQREGIALVQGTTDAAEIGFAMNIGYEGRINKLDYNVFASLDWIELDVDGYSEHSAGDDAVFTFRDFQRNSKGVEIGTQFRYTVNTSFGVLVPYTVVSYRGGFSNDDWQVVGRYSNFPDTEIRMTENAFDEDRGALQLGLTAVLPDGLSAYIAYETEHGREDWQFDRYDLGARWEF